MYLNIRFSYNLGQHFHPYYSGSDRAIRISIVEMGTKYLGDLDNLIWDIFYGYPISTPT